MWLVWWNVNWLRVLERIVELGVLAEHLVRRDKATAFGNIWRGDNSDLVKLHDRGWHFEIHVDQSQ